jgi:hypothetical protein
MPASETRTVHDGCLRFRSAQGMDFTSSLNSNPTFMSIPLIDSTYATEALRMQGGVKKLGVYQAKISKLIRKGKMPSGTGFNWQALVYNRTLPTTSPVWSAVQANDGSTNSCQVSPHLISSSFNIHNYSAFQTAFRSEDICATDAWASYEVVQQTEKNMQNFEENIEAAWQQRDREMYTLSCRWKYVATNSLNRTVDSAEFPLIAPTAPISADLMQEFYTRQERMGGANDGGAYAMDQGAPVFMVLASSEAIRQLIRTDTEVRQDYRFAEEGMGDKATLLKSWNINRPYGGFFYAADDRMPRWDLVDGAWVERPFYENASGAYLGTRADPSLLYENALFEDVQIFHPGVVERQMPPPSSSAGSKTDFKPVDYNGEVVWLNIPNLETNPLQQVGLWYASLRAAYRPELIDYGTVIRVNRCTSTTRTFASCATVSG